MRNYLLIPVPVPETYESLLHNQKLLTLLKEQGISGATLGYAVAGLHFSFTAQKNNLILFLDETSTFIIIQDIWRYIYSLLNTSTKKELQQLYRKAIQEKKLLHRSQRDVISYMSYAGACLFSNPLFSFLPTRARKVSKKDPELSALLQTISWGKGDFFT